MTVFNFNFESDISNWRTVDDIVMGGQSKGNFIKNDDGNGVFFGAVSLENNGGFSMVKCQVKTLNTQSF